MLELALRGLDPPGIAAGLGVSEATVSTHWKAIREKCAAGDRAQVLAAFARWLLEGQ